MRTLLYSKKMFNLMQRMPLAIGRINDVVNGLMLLSDDELKQLDPNNLCLSNGYSITINLSDVFLVCFISEEVFKIDRIHFLDPLPIAI